MVKTTDWRAIYVLAITAFITTFQMAILMTVVWPYLQEVRNSPLHIFSPQIDSTATVTFYGYISAASMAGNTLSAPLAGWWSNRACKIKSDFQNGPHALSGFQLLSVK